ncbi:hypothetical protein GEV33_002985 [Tenebrio molitor]|uniref:Cilia- and flagella-associated protein 126 n=1 Tax=Tenebrio molitor TaxID=7067 RepID=A0A8J6HT10_TENMO|nr:hypothetical protein GEV33_002985 [Tenebrio molitor]
MGQRWFEQAYKPRVLRNWEVPKRYNDKPKRRTGRTEVISNDRGHLLPGVPKSKSSPWGSFMGTWHFPKKIDRKTADELNGTVKNPTCEEKRQAKELRQKLEQIVEENEKKVEQVEATEGEVAQEAQENQIEEVEERDGDKENTRPYVPGDVTDPQHRLSNHQVLAESRYGDDRPSRTGYPRYRDDFSSRQLPQIDNKINRDEVEEECQRHKAMAEASYRDGVRSCKKKQPSAILAAIKNFQLAKKLHRENLEHDPLPDTITNLKYRQLQMQRSGKEPGLALKDDNFATGVGWKGYPGYGPTRCTKMKVYRPKTCGHGDNHEVKNDGRPSSVTSFDRKWRFIRQRKVSPIELAICWDLTPENPNDEPKRTPHIDGSNGSLAPAVFSLVHTPKEEEESTGTVDSGPVFEKRPVKDPRDKDFVLDRPKTSLPQDQKRRTSGESSKSGGSLGKKRAKSAYNLDEEEEERKSCSNCSQNEVHQSTPNLSDKKGKHSRMCMACEMRNVSLKDRRAKNEYKMAFKAGVPQKCVSRPSYNRIARCNFNVPKQKDPYSPKNYAIRSLAPPFSLQKDKRQDYPEHWRLATVYQHSYKPIHTRKRPLLATVFK